MVKIVSLSKGKEKGNESIEGTFLKEGRLLPLSVSRDDQPGLFYEIEKLIKEANGKDIDEELFILMSPADMLEHEIKESTHLSDNLKFVGSKLYFGDFVLEDTLAEHILSLLTEDNIPKDETLWKSYIKFLDNLHQNVSEDIRKQLFRWMEYETKAGNHFGITEDGCIVGYKGCDGSVALPVSRFSGTAIVDGVTIEGHIPNKVGSVVQMPRMEVQHDPAVGCAVGLHVGTRDYATAWAPVLLAVKVNPRDVVSVPYEVDSQKIRVCEYEVLEVTNEMEEHKRFYESEYEDETETLTDMYYDNEAVNDVDPEDLANSLLETKVSINYGDDELFGGIVVDVYLDEENTGVIIKDDEGNYKHIKLYRLNDITVFDSTEDMEENNAEYNEYDDIDRFTMEDAEELEGEHIYVEYDDGDSSFIAKITDIYKGPNPGLILQNDDGEYKHIKFNRISYWEEAEQDEKDSNDSLIDDIMSKLQ